MKRPIRKQAGQSLAILAIFAVTLFVFMGVGIDSGMLYLQRRHLQNATDAACLAAATRIAAPNLPGDPDAGLTTEQVAEKYIDLNLDSSPLAFLTQSISPTTVISGSDVRVRVDARASSFFLQFMDIDTYAVTARSRCDTTEAGGLWPVAVDRFPGYDNQGNTNPDDDERIGKANPGAPLPQTFANGPGESVLTVRDTLQAGSENSGILHADQPSAVGACNNLRNWYDWPDLGSPMPPYGTGPTGPFAQPCKAATPADPGFEVTMAGNGADPNISGGGGYTGPLLLDYRQVSHPQPLFYNGMNSQTGANAWKDTIVDNILQGYKGPDVLPGQELAVVDGVNAGQVLDAIRDRHEEGDVVTALVYNGVQYKEPDFTLRVTCAQGQGPASDSCNNDGSNNGKFVKRPAPTSDPTAANGCQIDGQAYIAEAGGFQGVVGTMQPAEYRVRLTPVNSASGMKVQLTARLSGAKDTGASGDALNFADLQVRWKWNEGGADQDTGWQNPDVPVEVNVAVNQVRNVSLFVKQNETTSCTPADDSDPLTPAPSPRTVPVRDSGAHTIQVIGRSVSATSSVHSDFGVLGMSSYTGDHFMSFVTDPSVSLRAPSLTTRLPLSIVNTSGTVLRWNDVKNFPSSHTVSPSAPFAVTFTNQGTTPVVQIDATGVPTGEYDIDFQLNTPTPHAVRIHVRVDASTNPSINSWVVALCYANFEITDLSDPNRVKGRALSGCLAPNAITTGLKARLLPWTD